MVLAMTPFCPSQVAYLGAVSSSNFLRCQQDETEQAGRQTSVGHHQGTLPIVDHSNMTARVQGSL